MALVASLGSLGGICEGNISIAGAKLSSRVWNMFGFLFIGARLEFRTQDLLQKAE
jgi:hypothetical protein